MTMTWSALKDALSSQGIVTAMISGNQMSVSLRSGPPWPDAGNSFSISNVNGSWYLCTWAPVCYRLPEQTDIAALCEEFVHIGAGAQAVVPPDIVARYSLVELDFDTASRLFGFE